MPLKNKKILVEVVPHGINGDLYKTIESDSKELKARYRKHFGDKKYDFVLFYNSRNISRKRTANIIVAFRAFCDNLTTEQADKCVLLLHTEKVLDAGTDLVAVKQALCKKYNVIIDDTKCSPEELVLDYNIADVLVNISSSEGFGLSCAEAIMCGTPVLVNVTGGLQDQIGQTDDEGEQLEFDLNFTSNHTGKYRNHGVWAYPVYPAARYIQGSPQTPYLFDDICTWEDVAEGMMYWYMMSNETREKCGARGQEWAKGDGHLSNKYLSSKFIECMNHVFDNFVPVKPFDIFSTKDFIELHDSPSDSIGGEIPVINIERLNQKINETISKI